MELLISLLFVCALISKAYPLQCNQCIPTGVGSCTQTQETCPAFQTRCGSVTVASYMGSFKLAEVNMKSCAAPAECVSGSVNFGVSRTTVSTRCCDGNLCNTQNAPALPDGSPNGKQCFTCEGTDCTHTLKCLGSEDRCIKASVKSDGQTVTVKGCVSQTACAGTLNAQLGNTAVDMSCCEGDLCNNARRIGQSVLLLLVSVASIILFH
ncbi:urokinase plasminogen activator surface receptor-like [Megalops cyprinoides]|uniref:urokinase plasminogen activator surface receptor-like n=1 Tax=Megalops cyprinoides TaxID=118141 RepID=UPI00186547CF|nr:urokinase plasminogen activator surface receptor-like [Megalops cyprinoides]